MLDDTAYMTQEILRLEAIIDSFVGMLTFSWFIGFLMIIALAILGVKYYNLNKKYKYLGEIYNTCRSNIGMRPYNFDSPDGDQLWFLPSELAKPKEKCK